MTILCLHQHYMCSCHLHFAFIEPISVPRWQILCKSNIILHQQAYPNDASFILTTVSKRTITTMGPPSSIEYTMQSLHPARDGEGIYISPTPGDRINYDRMKNSWSPVLSCRVPPFPCETILSIKCDSMHACKNACWRMMMMTISSLKQSITLYPLPAFTPYTIPRTHACNHANLHLCKFE